MLNNDFYTISALRHEDGLITASLELNKAHAIFEGHFPGNPVTPGVVQMEIIKELVGNVLQQKVSLKSMSNCKFLAILNPEQTPVVNVEIKLAAGENNELKATSAITAGEVSFFKMSAVYLT